MDLFAIFSDPEAVRNFLSGAASSKLTEYLIVVAVVWHVMGRKVIGHFGNLERALDQVAQEVRDLRRAVTADLSLQSSRLESVENGVVELNSRVTKLENQGESDGKGNRS